MKAIMVMFDSLNRHMLPPYGCKWIHAPNFTRLAEKSLTFNTCYAGSLPCMPARREIHTGRYNFLHRSWGPLEPFDDSMPEILYRNGIYPHLVSDHYHYWEDGGSTYHTRYGSWEISRGQEGDPWKGEIEDPIFPQTLNDISKVGKREDWINRKYMDSVDKQPQAKTFEKGIDFIRTNYKQDDWFLHIETFDPHEPFFTQERFKDLYPHDYEGPHFDWPSYRRVTETKDQVKHCRSEYAALLSMCDKYLGKILDDMDELDLWKDTMLIVNTDHGFLLGEHGWWAKCKMPFYNEIAHIPLFIWDPRSKRKGERCNCLVQTIDLAPSLLDFFGVEIPEDMQGSSLKESIASDTPVRNSVLFGIFGGHVNCTDGKYVYMRAPVNKDNLPLYEYTLMPTQHGRRRAFFEIDRLADFLISEPFSFSKNCRLMKIRGKTETEAHPFGTLLFDLDKDPKQEQPIKDRDIENRMENTLVQLMEQNDSPIEQYRRLGLDH